MLSSLLHAFVAAWTATILAVVGFFLDPATTPSSVPVLEPATPVQTVSTQTPMGGVDKAKAAPLPTKNQTGIQFHEKETGNPITVSVPLTPIEETGPEPDMPMLPERPDLPGTLAVLPKSTPSVPVSRAGALSPTEILALTNTERTERGLRPLVLNTTLTAIAEEKARDMIARQYFAHESPSGVDVSGLAEQYGYNYRLIGENLAMGDLGSSAGVVDGWMNSPGHRANILKDEYTEIGIAAIKGPWNEEGRDLWFAVQEFGHPLPHCDSPDKAAKYAIANTNTQLEELATVLDSMNTAIDEPGISYAERSQRIDDYNKLVASYNTLLRSQKDLVTTYNESVKAYNACIQG